MFFQPFSKISFEVKIFSMKLRFSNEINIFSKKQKNSSKKYYTTDLCCILLLFGARSWFEMLLSFENRIMEFYFHLSYFCWILSAGYQKEYDGKVFCLKLGSKRVQQEIIGHTYFHFRCKLNLISILIDIILMISSSLNLKEPQCTIAKKNLFL